MIYYVRCVGVRFAIPHDLAHFVVEQSLHLDRGFWGTISAGGVFASMQHVRGRRKPRADEHSRRLMKANHDYISEAEGLVAIINNALEEGHAASSRYLRTRLESFAFTPRNAQTRAISDSDLERACSDWLRMRDPWRSLTVGKTMTLTWDEHASRSMSRTQRH